MRRVLNITASMVLISGASFAVEVESVEQNSGANITILETMSATPTEVTRVKVKDSGVESFVLVPKANSNNIGTLSPNMDDKLNSKKGLIIAFKDKNVDIAPLEALFNISLKEKLQSGFYIFKNLSGLSDVALIEAILKSDSQDMIKTLRPNWEMGVEKF
ncbi:hypothetical protein MNB_SV-12-1127 [hydrothermal vent metagenome]|uniref:Uncharacterized protein n=1 Tax=hydrothermal vent metagenome TaxID=652676 RepID=A0A1W1BBT2_9ZZZZ